MPKPFRCVVVTPEQQVLDEQVSYVSLPAWDGQLGVQHLRAPLLARLGYGTLTLTPEQGDRSTWFVGGGFAQVKDDVLTLLAEEALEPKNIDRSKAEAALAEAQAFKPTSEADLDRRHRDLTRARAMVAMAP